MARSRVLRQRLTTAAVALQEAWEVRSHTARHSLIKAQSHCFAAAPHSSEQNCSLSNVEQLLPACQTNNGGAIQAGCLAARARKRRNRMKVISRTVFYSLMIISLIGFTRLMWAQSTDQQENLFACKNGWDTCNPSALTQANKNEVAAARHAQNISDCENDWTSCNRSALSEPERAEVAVVAHRNMVSDCWNGAGSCDHAKLTAPEAAGVAVAENQRNVSDCWNGWPSCKLSKLSPSELSDITVAQRRRNVTECWDGWADCDRSKLSTSELNAVMVSDHQRNYMACVSGFVGCDASRLTPAEASAITAGKNTTSP